MQGALDEQRRRCSAASGLGPLPRRRQRVGARASCASASATIPTCSIRRLSRTYTGRIVFASLCDKLFDIDEKLAHRAAARARPRDLGRRQDGHHQAPARREVPRRRAVRRRGRQVQPRSPPHHEGLVPQARDRLDRQRRGRRSADHQAQPQGAVLAAARPAHRPRRHDGLAQGGRSGGRQVRPEAGLRRPLQVRRARPAGPHRGREVRRLLEQGPGLHRQDHLPADRRRARCGWPTCAPAAST